MLSSTNFHSEFRSLQVALHEIGVNGFRLNQTISSEALSVLIAEPCTQELSYSSRAPATINLLIEREFENNLLLKGKADLKLETSCVRCLRAFDLDIAMDFSMRLLEKNDSLEQDDSKSWDFDSDSDDSLDDSAVSVGYFSGRSIDLGLILREQIFLRLPNYPRCGIEEAVSNTACMVDQRYLNNEENIKNPFKEFFSSKRKNEIGE